MRGRGSKPASALAETLRSPQAETIRGKRVRGEDAAEQWWERGSCESR